MATNDASPEVPKNNPQEDPEVKTSKDLLALKREVDPVPEVVLATAEVIENTTSQLAELARRMGREVPPMPESYQTKGNVQVA